MKSLLLLTIVGLLSCSSGSKKSEVNSEKDNSLTVNDTSFTWGEESNGLKLGISFTDDSLEMKIKNVSDSVIKVCSHINLNNLDWYFISVIDQSGNQRTIHIGEAARTGSEMHTQTLNSRESFSHKIDLQHWAEQEINKKEKLLPGKYKATVTYEANDCFYPSKEY